MNIPVGLGGGGTNPRLELRLYGLIPGVPTDSLFRYIEQQGGMVIHPQEGFSNYAQFWVGDESEVENCMALRSVLAEKNITISRAPTYSQLPHPWNSPISSPSIPLPNSTIPPNPTTRGLRPDLSTIPYRHLDPHGALPRNVYVMNLPLDYSQQQFRNLFTHFGMIEHSMLLSQLDGMGRRRGFVLMSTHREATEALQSMNGKWIDGSRIDVSWALVQREAKHVGNHYNNALPNRVIHPPSVSLRREVPPECSVMVDNLNPYYFPTAGLIREAFSSFGPVLRVTVTQTTQNRLQAIIQFEHHISATALCAANGMSLGGRAIITRPWDIDNGRGHTQQQLRFDPFGEGEHNHNLYHSPVPNQHSQQYNFTNPGPNFKSHPDTDSTNYQTQTKNQNHSPPLNADVKPFSPKSSPKEYDISLSLVSNATKSQSSTESEGSVHEGMNGNGGKAEKEGRKNVERWSSTVWKSSDEGGDVLESLDTS